MRMTPKRFLLVSALGVLVAVSFAGGTWWAHRNSVEAPQTTARAIIPAYTCPMHPGYRSDRPGDCPSCGMRLEPVPTGTTAPLSASDAAHPLPRGTVIVSAERQQAIGVRLGVAARVSGTRMLRTTGRVAARENATYPIIAGAEGLVREVRGATTGSLVKKDEVLLSFYAPEFLTAQQSYFSGLDTVSRVTNEQLQNNQTRAADGVERFANTLRNLGVSEQQLAEMRTSRKLAHYVHITSPVDGFVLQRNVSLGARFDRGFEFYRIADLSRVWILADVYPHQLPFIRRGAAAGITTPQENHALSATVSDAEPIFDEGTLTLKARLEAVNPGFVLKPGMFVDVDLPIDLPASLVVTADAIVDSGLRKTVFVERGNGYFEPRQVETGWRIGDEVEVTKGLMPGERIVISGTFLIDSESRMKAAAHKTTGVATRDPVCGMQVDEDSAAAGDRRVDHGGRTFFFCSDDCKHQFQKEPARFDRDAARAP